MGCEQFYYFFCFCFKITRSDQNVPSGRWENRYASHPLAELDSLTERAVAGSFFIIHFFQHFCRFGSLRVHYLPYCF